MPRDNVPRDLIQEVVDILTGDNQEVEIYTQGTRHGGVVIFVGTLFGLTGDNSLLIDNMRIKGSTERSDKQHKIHLSSVIQIQTIQGD